MANVLQAKETRTHLVCVSSPFKSQHSWWHWCHVAWVTCHIFESINEAIFDDMHTTFFVLCLFVWCCPAKMLCMHWYDMKQSYQTLFFKSGILWHEKYANRDRNSFQVSNRGKHFKTTTDLSHGWCLKRWRKHPLSQVFETWYWDQIQNLFIFFKKHFNTYFVLCLCYLYLNTVLQITAFDFNLHLNVTEQLLGEVGGIYCIHISLLK